MKQPMESMHGIHALRNKALQRPNHGFRTCCWCLCKSSQVVDVLLVQAPKKTQLSQGVWGRRSYKKPAFKLKGWKHQPLWISWWPSKSIEAAHPKDWLHSQMPATIRATIMSGRFFVRSLISGDRVVGPLTKAKWNRKHFKLVNLYPAAGIVTDWCFCA